MKVKSIQVLIDTELLEGIDQDPETRERALLVPSLRRRTASRREEATPD